jgi:hypothetical protein
MGSMRVARQAGIQQVTAAVAATSAIATAVDAYATVDVTSDRHP